MRRDFASALLVLLAVALTGCTQEVTAYFVNPCDSALDIATYDTGDPAQMLPGSLSRRVRLAPLSVTRVAGAFQYWGGPKRWLVGVGGTSSYVTVDGDAWVNNTVAIPARFCGTPPSDPSPSATPSGESSSP